ncbi:MAG: permease-like cell division protein FtsX [Pseudomonadales bacterium]|nr:permease-like cell division protein FtsX [Pseudomonadales bacterium]
MPWARTKRNRRAWIRDHVRFCKEALHQMLLHVIMTFFVMLLIGVSIALPSGLWVIRDYLSYADLAWPTERGFNAFFHSDASETQIDSTAQTIRNHGFVNEAFLIPKSVALQEFLTAADLPDLTDRMPENPLPDTLTVFVKENIQVHEIETLTDFIQQLDAVDQVSYDTQIIVRFSAIHTIFNRLLWVVAGTFCLFALFVSASAVRIAIESRLQEIRILHVIGSPKRITRGPFLWCGFMYGALGGILAAVLLTLVLIYVEEPLRTLTASYGVRRDLQSLDWSFVGIVCAVGALLGLSSALYSTSRHLQRVTRNWEI